MVCFLAFLSDCAYFPHSFPTHVLGKGLLEKGGLSLICLYSSIRLSLLRRTPRLEGLKCPIHTASGARPQPGRSWALKNARSPLPGQLGDTAHRKPDQASNARARGESYVGHEYVIWRARGQREGQSRCWCQRWS